MNLERSWLANIRSRALPFLREKVNLQRSLPTGFLIKALPFLVILIVALIALHRVLFTPGLILYGDFVSTFDVDQSLVNSYPLWSNYGSYPVPADNALWVLGPAYAIASALNIPAEWFYKLLILGIMVLTGLSMYYAANILIKEVIKSRWIAFTAAIIAALVYMFNPWVLPHITHIPMWVGYALSPLILVCFMKALKTRRFIYIIATALLWSVASADPRYIVFSGLLILSWLAFSLISQLMAGDRSTALSYIKITALVAVLYIPFNAFWLFSHAATQQITPLYQISYEDINHISRNGSLLNVIRFMGFWGPWGTGTAFYEPASESLHHLWTTSSFVVPLFAFASLLFKPNNNGGLKYASYFALMSVPLIFLGMGTQSPFPSIYNWLVFDVPFLSDKVGWMFREPDKWVGLLAMVLCFLIALTIAGMLKSGWEMASPVSGALRRSWKKLSSMAVKGILIAITMLFVLSFALFAAPADAHFFADFLVPHKVPQEFYDVDDWLAGQEGDFKVMYLPQIAGPHEWGPLDLSRMFLPWSVTAKTTIVGDPFTAPSVDYFYNYIYYDSLLQDETLNFGKYLAPYNERYVIVHNDTAYPWEKEKVNTAIENLKHQNDMSFLGQEGYVYVFENENYVPHVFIPYQNFLISGGLDTLEGFNDLDAFDPNYTGLLYFDQGFPSGYPDAKGVILSQRNDIYDVALSQVADKYLIAPFEYTDRFYPRDFWSKVGLVNWYWFWGSNPYGPDPWDFDYGKGFVTNYDFRPVTESVSPCHIDTGNAEEWHTVTVSASDHINVSSDGQSLTIDYTFDNESALSVYAQTWFDEENWECYDTRSMWVYGDGSGNTLDTFYFHTNIDGSQGWSGMRSHPIDWVGWKEVTDVIPESLRDRVSQFMIALSWDLNKSQAGLGSHRIMIKDVVVSGEGEAVSSPRRSLHIPVKIEESGRYQLYARVLESPSGGELSVLLDGQKIASVNTVAGGSNFVWKDLGGGVLDQGTVYLTLENSLGLNAVNVLALIPEDVAQGYFDSARQFLEGKSTIHIWKGKIAAPRTIETGHIAEQLSPYLIATGDTGNWGTTHNTDNEDINISSDGQSLVIDYTFADESALSAYALNKFALADWTDYDTLYLSVYGDGSGNSLNFWYHQVNPDGSDAWHAIRFCTLNWTGWKELSFNMPQLPRDSVDLFMIALSWDLTKSQAGLGSHQIKIEDIKFAASQWRGFGVGPEGYVDRLGSEDGALVIDYTFEDENSLSVYAQTDLELEDWIYRDTLTLSVYGDGSGNRIDFWYQRVNDDGTISWYGMGACPLDWIGWKELSFPVGDWPKDNVKHFTVSVAWDIYKSQAGLGSHQIKVKDIAVSIGAPEAATTGIDVLRDSEYRIGVLAPTGPNQQPITLKVNDQELVIDLTGDEEGLEWAYSEPIFLYAGQHTIQVYSGMAVIDRLMLFSTSSDDTLDDIFQVSNIPASVSSWEERSATKYVVHVDAKSPFMLALAEAYNSHWVAKVNGREYKSQPLYAVINGFWIEETGELEITIEYEPQRWFDYGAIISVISLLGALAFVVWDVRLRWDHRMRLRLRGWLSYGAACAGAVMRNALALVAEYWRRARDRRN